MFLTAGALFLLYHNEERGGGCALAFAAAAANKKNKQGGGGSSKKKRAAAASNRGFGKAPPTLEETLATFKSRRPDPSSYDRVPCPCGVGNEMYGACCAPYLSDGGEKPILSPTRVLQTRYTAFCYRDVGHIIRTTHPSCRDYQEDKIAWAKELNKNGMFDSFDFVGLTILGEEEHTTTTEAFVEFEVKLRANQRTGSLLEGQVTNVRERSRFLKDEESGSWSYASGDVRSTVEGVDDIVLNS